MIHRFRDLDARRRSAVLLASVLFLVLAPPATAARCDGPPTEEQLADPSKKNWKFCITVVKLGENEWAFADDRKSKPIEVGINDDAEIIFMMDRDLHPDAWLAEIRITRVGGTTPADEFVGENGHKFHQTGTLKPNGKQPRFKVKNKNSVKAEYEYEVAIKTKGSDTLYRVDPRIRNGGRQN